MAFSCVLETPDFKIFHMAPTKVAPPGVTQHVLLSQKMSDGQNFPYFKRWITLQGDGNCIYFRPPTGGGTKSKVRYLFLPSPLSAVIFAKKSKLSKIFACGACISHLWYISAPLLYYNFILAILYGQLYVIA